MRIAYTDFHQDWGGQASQVLLLALGMRRRGHEVAIAAPAGSVLLERARAQGLRVSGACGFRRGFRPLAFHRDLRAIRRIVSDHNAEIVHSHGSQDTWLAALARPVYGLGYALVRTKHNCNPVQPHRANRWLYGRALEHLIAINQQIQQDAMSGGGVPARLTTVIPPGVADDFSHGGDACAAASVREELGIPIAAQLVGQIGRLEPVKGQELLLRAFVQVRRQHPQAHLLLVGTGGDYHRLLGIRASLGLDACAHLPLFRADVARIAAALDVAVTPSLTESWGLAVVEAMALGVPVVVTDCGGPATIVANGELGVLVPRNDAAALARGICSVLGGLGTPDLLARTDRARERATALYGMGTVAAATERVYSAALEARRPC